MQLTLLPPDPVPMLQVTDPPDPSCYHLFFGAEIGEYQSLDPDLFLHLQVRRGRERTEQVRKSDRPKLPEMVLGLIT
jgi:hypothetical protein